MISSDALCGRRAVLAHSGGRLAAARRTPERFSTLARIVSFDDIPIARRLVMCGEPKQHRRAAFAAARADETVRPASFEQERNAARFVRKMPSGIRKANALAIGGYVLATSRGHYI